MDIQYLINDKNLLNEIETTIEELIRENLITLKKFSIKTFTKEPSYIVVSFYPRDENQVYTRIFWGTEDYEELQDHIDKKLAEYNLSYEWALVLRDLMESIYEC